MRMIERTSTKFESAVGFSNGIDELTLKKSAAVGAELLDGNLRGDRAERERLIGPLEGGRVHRASEGLQRPLGNENQSHGDREREEDVVEAPDQVLPRSSPALRRSAR